MKTTMKLRISLSSKYKWTQDAQSRIDAQPKSIVHGRIKATGILRVEKIPFALSDHDMKCDPIWSTTVRESVPVAKLITGQCSLSPVGVAAADLGVAIHVIRYCGKLYIMDGNHRAAKASLLGQTYIKADVATLTK